MSTILPADLQYTDSHEWVKDEGNGLYRVGITEHAQSLLGDVVFIDLPTPAKRYQAGEECATVESVKAVSDIYAPFDGEIVEVNSQLDDTPEAVNSSPYEDGWMFLIKSERPEQVAALLSAEDYHALIAD
ncbi:glycine cleavage system protein GcvH [Mixta tenebrionis]|uniref:Glycine cleavage system H protein n=1 Tax=Mixta tenebrionis TaxID=2562439 RepID=A0A506UZA1_9GAMM|nr:MULTISPECIES: glycine cleavage system protein GcvH [Mixta]QHM75108.1 Glycine cleavage system H protein [Mixta theicola]TPW38689.1 glycine cleavage system protein GcvH [Mixta tenebrionis]